MVSFLPKLSLTKEGFDNDSRTLIWGSVNMGMGYFMRALEELKPLWGAS
jgi:hypothetical protein